MLNANAMLYGMMAGQQVGQYHLESLLGAGGFGGVFRANEVVRDRVLRQVAVKVIPGNDEAQLEELLAAATLEHDHLIRCYAAGECHLLNIDALYLAMELGEGSLDNHLHLQQGPLEMGKVREVLREVTQGLAYLHDQNQVHRDLKPANVLRARGRWKLSDFGLVRRLGNESYAQTANPIGTIAYMPPEAFEGQISPAWDMWSLGIMAVQMLTGSIPYQFSEPTQLLKLVMDGKLHLPPLPDDFEEIVEGCLQMNRGDRWSAEQILETLNPKGSQPVIQYSTHTKSIDLPSIIEELGGDVILELVQLPAGSFLMGSLESDPDASNDKKPQHRVKRVKMQSFAIGKYPVTQAQYQAVMGENPSYFKGDPDRPVERISWDKAKEFCKKLARKTKKRYRLPSESEWEYACRAGTKTLYYFGDNADQLGEYAWFRENSNEQTHPVGQKKPNKWGLYDMHGNIFEWCGDETLRKALEWYEANNSNKNTITGVIKNLVFPSDLITETILRSLQVDQQILKGGAWLSGHWNCHSSASSHDQRRKNGLRPYGFRIVLETNRI
jgi:formylglycine-generating enzyme required for sulfatase activity